MLLPTIITKEFQQSLKPDDVIKVLKSGNKRFMQSINVVKDVETQRKNLSSAQFPIAVILGCIDSRAPSEIIFDLGLGAVFNIRIAGNIVNEDILGSIEFATEVSGAKLILVMGHTDCGAIKAACNNVELGNITAIMNKIKPVIESSKKTTNSDDFANDVIHENARYVKNQIIEKSEIVKNLIDNKKVKILSSVYNIETGEVVFDK